MAGMWIVWLAAIGLTIFLIRLLARRSDGGRSRGESPEEVLKRRYAKGEIDQDEYERRLADLRK